MAKGLAILLMIQVHLIQLFASPEIFESIGGRISLFLGGTFVAPVFMVVMGFFLAKSRKSARQLYGKGFRMLVLALILNTGLNLHLFFRIYTGALKLDFRSYLFGVDILWLAALSIIFIAWWKNISGMRPWWTIFLALFIVILTPFLNEGLTIESPAKYLLAFFGGTYNWSYFPLLPWLAYPLVGFFAGSLNVQKIPWSILFCSSSIFLLLLKYGVETSINLKAYYHHGLLFFIWSMSLLACWFGFLGLLQRYIGKNRLFHFIRWMGKHVTEMYVLQWLVIGNLATVFYKTLSFTALIFWYFLIVGGVSILVYIWTTLLKLRKD